MVGDILDFGTKCIKCKRKIPDGAIYFHDNKVGFICEYCSGFENGGVKAIETTTQSKTIDQWEADAKEWPNIYKHIPANVVTDRILALIDLVRKKDDALKEIIAIVPHAEAYDALELTEDLK